MIRIIACGKVKKGWMKDGIDDYTKRISPYGRIEIIETADEKAPESNSAAKCIATSHGGFSLSVFIAKI